ncbi:MAG: methyltransferase domain-containing protein [Candidatus Aenigmarchaeota archaeon]|nr:methyltransferase domain-containing protein [Candidatus Aenigmarchaeota archaeon]
MAAKKERGYVVDTFHKMRRGPQILTQKDIGLILGMTGCGSGWRVVEAGSGSGALSMFLANAVQPKGMLYSYDWRTEHLEIAKENIKRAGLTKFVEFAHADIAAGIKQKSVEMVVLDLAEPWLVVPHAEEALKPGGFFVAYVPTYEQMKEIVTTLRNYKFKEPKAYDHAIREYQVEENATRPVNVGLVHTGFLIFARKLSGINKVE